MGGGGEEGVKRALNAHPSRFFPIVTIENPNGTTLINKRKSEENTGFQEEKK
jgi:hypothetical protein